jgi:hypothetical protein
MDGRSIRTIRCIGRGEPGIGATLLNPPGKAPNRMGGAGADAPVDPCHLRTGKNPGIAGHSNKFYCNFSVLRDAAAERREARIFKSRLRGAIVHAYEARRAPDLGPAALASRRSNLALRGGPRFRLMSEDDALNISVSLRSQEDYVNPWTKYCLTPNPANRVCCEWP